MASILAHPIGTDFLCKVQDHPMESKLQLSSSNDEVQFVQIPGEDPATNITLNKGELYFLVNKHISGSIKLNGDYVKVSVEDSGKKARPALEGWAKTLDSKQENEKVPSNFVVKVQEMFEELDIAAFTRTKTTKERAIFLKTEYQGGIRNKIEEKAHSYLRKLGHSRSDKSLWRKYTNLDNKADVMLKKINKLHEILPELKNENESDDTPRCFVSMETSLETAIVAIEESIQMFDNFKKIDADKCLRLFGLIGVPITHVVNNYTDPMNLGVNHGASDDTISGIYPGTFLNQCSLWHAAKLGKKLKAPGFEEEITAVVPIKSWNNPLVWRAYSIITSISELQATAQIRRTITPLPNDRNSLGTSSLLKMIKIWEKPTEIQAKLMTDLLTTLQLNFSVAPKLVQNLMGKDPDTFIINNMPSTLAPFSKILMNQDLLKFAGGKDSGKFWRAVVSNATHWRVRRSCGNENRNQSIQKLFSCNVNLTKPMDFQVILDQAEKYAEEHEFVETVDLFLRVHAIARASNEKIGPDLFGNPTLTKEEFAQFITKYNWKLFSVIEVTKALLCKHRSDRITHAMKLAHPHHSNEEEARNWLDVKIKSLKKEAIETMREEERKQQKLKGFISKSDRLSLEEFAKEMEEIQETDVIKIHIGTTEKQGLSRTKSGSPSMLVLQKITDKLSGPGVKSLKEKIKLLLIGKSESQVWNNGTVLRNSAIRKCLLAMLKPLIKSQEYEVLRKYVQKYEFAKHRYREYPDSRKGYSNDRPSFWAVTGFSDPWSYYKNEPLNYEKFLEQLTTFESGETEVARQFCHEWKHLLTENPTKHYTLGTGRVKRSGSPKKIKKRKMLETIQETKFEEENLPYTCNIDDKIDENTVLRVQESFEVFSKTLVGGEIIKQSKNLIEIDDIKILKASWTEIVSCLLPSQSSSLIQTIQQVSFHFAGSYDENESLITALRFLTSFARMKMIGIKDVNKFLVEKGINNYGKAMLNDSGPSEVILQVDLPKNLFPRINTEMSKKEIITQLDKGFKSSFGSKTVLKWLKEKLQNEEEFKYSELLTNDIFQEFSFDEIKLNIIDIYQGSLKCIVQIKHLEIPDNPMKAKRMTMLTKIIETMLRDLPSCIKCGVDKGKDPGKDGIRLSLKLPADVTSKDEKDSLKKWTDTFLNEMRQEFKTMLRPDKKEKIIRELQKQNFCPVAIEELVSVIESSKLLEKDKSMIDVEIDVPQKLKVETVRYENIPLWPYKSRKLSELDESTKFDILEIFRNSFPRHIWEDVAAKLDKFRVANKWMQLTKEISKLDKDTSPFPLLISTYAEEDGTIEGLLKCLSECRKNEKMENAIQEHIYPKGKTSKNVVDDMVFQINACNEKCFKEWLDKYQFAEIGAGIANFDSFLNASKTMTTAEFLQGKLMKWGPEMKRLLREGDQIWMWRKVGVIEYAHVAIYIGDEKNEIVHVSHENMLGIVKKDPAENVIGNSECFIIRPDDERVKSLGGTPKQRALACLNPPIQFLYDVTMGTCEVFVNCITQGIWTTDLIGKQTKEHEHINSFIKGFNLLWHWKSFKTQREDLLTTLAKRLIERRMDDNNPMQMLWASGS